MAKDLLLRYIAHIRTGISIRAPEFTWELREYEYSLEQDYITIGMRIAIPKTLQKI